MTSIKPILYSAALVSMAVRRKHGILHRLAIVHDGTDEGVGTRRVHRGRGAHSVFSSDVLFPLVDGVDDEMQVLCLHHLGFDIQIPERRKHTRPSVIKSFQESDNDALVFQASRTTKGTRSGCNGNARTGAPNCCWQRRDARGLPAPCRPRIATCGLKSIAECSNRVVGCQHGHYQA